MYTLCQAYNYAVHLYNLVVWYVYSKYQYTVQSLMHRLISHNLLGDSICYNTCIVMCVAMYKDNILMN